MKSRQTGYGFHRLDRLMLAAGPVLLCVVLCSCRSTANGAKQSAVAENETHERAESATAPAPAEPDLYDELVTADCAWVEEHGNRIYERVRSNLDSPDADELIGLALLADQAEAIGLLNQAIVKDPESAFAYFLLGVTYKGARSGPTVSPEGEPDVEKARQALRTASELDPENALYDTFLMISYVHEGDLETASEILLSIKDRKTYSFSMWDMARARERALESAGEYDPEVARKLYSAENPFSLAGLVRPISKGIPANPTEGQTLDVDRFEKLAEAALHLNQLLTSSGGSLEFGMGSVLLETTGLRMSAVYHATGDTEKAAVAEEWVAEAEKQRDEFKERLDAGWCSWWDMKLHDLHDSRNAGEISQEDFEIARSAINTEMSKYFPALTEH